MASPTSRNHRPAVLPPGTLLQLMYLEERLEPLTPGRFVEIGPGAGEITQVLLDRGWSGSSYDLDSGTIAMLDARFAEEIAQQRFAAINSDFLNLPAAQLEPVDLVISCMVMEHLDEAAEARFMGVASRILRPAGLMIGFVPGSPSHWGIEDDIAGHCRRYTRSSFAKLTASNRWRILHMAGLTFPVSNLLLPLSNYLVRKSESAKLTLSALERTKQSGRREVSFKTKFPTVLGMVLNRVTMSPLHWLQKLFARSDSALVLYFEVKPSEESIHG
ncbi:16S ribosomal RNA methyltransferase KsgA/Dim1 family protein [Variovorax sp. SRS16]|uniref:methyltransferase domain-containing protein n=1 Tax=Variovorax sp. SRS16 TaxID=282217 RepID=UPI0013184CAA|nr:methyltransferase domain-containing protein [Variovorax sp. SRS16]VTU13707.1 16S ribosomal RNA methyltransferase KsgA/Dim1 family protein [Variovorax sp. SRS16]